ncbi:MAG: HEPN domain-containing protein [Mangrovibacterium sp.]
MKGSKQDLINYRLARAKDTFEDAQILSERGKWNSTMNRLYYAAYYAVMALLLNSDLKPTTHNGTKSNFSEYFIKSGSWIKNTARFILNYSYEDRKATMMIYSNLTKIK